MTALMMTTITKATVMITTQIIRTIKTRITMEVPHPIQDRILLQDIVQLLRVPIVDSIRSNVTLQKSFPTRAVVAKG